MEAHEAAAIISNVRRRISGAAPTMAAFTGAKDRDRVLSEAELAEIWRALPDSVYGTAIKLLMLTGQRCEEIGGLRWSEIDLTGELISCRRSGSRTVPRMRCH
jgi:integrase